jgi:hypothetical protein
MEKLSQIESTAGILRFNASACKEFAKIKGKNSVLVLLEDMENDAKNILKLIQAARDEVNSW